jgi:hypothetical protein
MGNVVAQAIMSLDGTSPNRTTHRPIVRDGEMTLVLINHRSERT